MCSVKRHGQEKVSLSEERRHREWINFVLCKILFAPPSLTNFLGSLSALHISSQLSIVGSRMVYVRISKVESYIKEGCVFSLKSFGLIFGQNIWVFLASLLFPNKICILPPLGKLWPINHATFFLPAPLPNVAGNFNDKCYPC